MPLTNGAGPTPATSDAPGSTPPAHRWFDGWTPLTDLDPDELRELALAEAKITRGSARDTWICPLPRHTDDLPSEPYLGPERRIPRDRKDRDT